MLIVVEVVVVELCWGNSKWIVLMMEELVPSRDTMWDFLSAKGPSLPCKDQGLFPSCWSGSPEFQAQAGFTPFV